MHILNLRRLLPSRKAWRAFTTKLQSKLHKLHTSKAIKKPKNHLNSTTSRAVFWPALPLQSHLKCKRRKRITEATHILRYQHRPYRLQKRPAPVYIDQLFIEPESVLKKGEKEKFLPNANKTGVFNEKAAVAGTSKEDGNNGMKHTADDMWESLALASPQMHGINERAEEFITRFRAEMQLQESLVRRL